MFHSCQCQNFKLLLAGVAHCAVNLDNIMAIQGSNEAWSFQLCGFDYSQLWDKGGRLSRTLKPSPYTAPEAQLGQYNHTAYLWSIGSVLYHLATGRPPVRGPEGKNGKIKSRWLVCCNCLTFINFNQICIWKHPFKNDTVLMLRCLRLPCRVSQVYRLESHCWRTTKYH